jgi:hypothetical protein
MMLTVDRQCPSTTSTNNHEGMEKNWTEKVLISTCDFRAGFEFE